MIKNIIIYIFLLTSAFVFNIFYYAWFSWFILLVILCIPLLSLLMSLPFMIISAVNRFIIFGNDMININDDFYIGAVSRKRKTLFCPIVKFTLTAKNSFAHQEKKIKILYGGNFNKPIYKKQNSLSDHCGCVEIRVKSCRIYDLTGIFFIPIKINFGFDTYVMPNPEKPNEIPQIENITVLGYKPKSGGGFSDYYELRQYQKGDNLKNIHWKLSTKSDDMIVKEPSQPIFKQFAVKAVFDNDSDKNDSILSRLIYICRFINKQGSVCFAFNNSNDTVSSIANDYDISMFIKSLYKKISYNECEFDRSNTLIYFIMGDCEEVLES